MEFRMSWSHIYKCGTFLAHLKRLKPIWSAPVRNFIINNKQSTVSAIVTEGMHFT